MTRREHDGVDRVDAELDALERGAPHDRQRDGAEDELEEPLRLDGRVGEAHDRERLGGVAEALQEPAGVAPQVAGAAEREREADGPVRDARRSRSSSAPSRRSVPAFLPREKPISRNAKPACMNITSTAATITHIELIPTEFTSVIPVASNESAEATAGSSMMATSAITLAQRIVVRFIFPPGLTDCGESAPANARDLWPDGERSRVRFRHGPSRDCAATVPPPRRERALIVPREGTCGSPFGGSPERSFGHADSVGTSPPSYARSARKSREGTPVHGQDPSAERQRSPVVAERHRPRRARPQRPREPDLRGQHLQPRRAAPAAAEDRLQAAAGDARAGRGARQLARRRRRARDEGVGAREGRDPLRALVPAADGLDRGEARLLLQPGRRRHRDRRVLRQGADPGRARRVLLPHRRHPRHVRGARLHRLGPDEPGLHPREPERRAALHPDGVHVVDGRGARPQDPAAALDGGALRRRRARAQAARRRRRRSASSRRSGPSRSTS